MKSFYFILPILLMLNFDNSMVINYSTFKDNKQIETSESNLTSSMTPEAALIGGGTITSSQNFSQCNTCADCSSGCVNSSGARATFTIRVNGIDNCGNLPPNVSLDFGSNWRHVSSMTKTSPTTWVIRFNVIDYSCSRPDTPFTFNIPVTARYFCWRNSPPSQVVNGNIRMIIC